MANSLLVLAALASLARADDFSIERIIRERAFPLVLAQARTPEAAPDLKALVGEHRGFIPAAKVAFLLQETHYTIDQLLVALIPVAKDVSRPLVSNYPVGAAGLGESGDIYLGGSLSFIGVPNGQSIHAEQAVVVNAKRHGETRLLALAVSDEPCGMCRQFLHELGTSERLRILVPQKEPATLSELLPRGFVFSGTPPNPLASMDARLAPPAVPIDASPDLVEAAFKAANAANTKYSPSGVALRTDDGRIFAGGYIEISGGNPSLPPLQTALIGLVLEGRPYGAIREAVLVELNDRVLQEAMTRELLRRIAPNAKFSAVIAERQK